MSPCGVNLTALPSRLMRIWRRRVESLVIRGGQLGSMKVARLSGLSPRRLAATRSTTASTNSRRWKVSASSSSLLASIFEKSRMSLMRVSSESHEPRRVSTKSR
jgi:hypothetical protein